MYPGTYKEFLWHKQHPEAAAPARQESRKAERQGARKPAAKPEVHRPSHEQKKRGDAEARKQQRAVQARRAEIDRLEAQIAACETAIREIEQRMSSPGFYDNRAAAQPVVDRHQALMWQVGDLMHQWEQLQARAEPPRPTLTNS